MIVFATLSVSSKLSSCSLLNPPLEDEVQLREWYTDNRDELKLMGEYKAYKDATILLPPPAEEDIVAIDKVLASFDNHKIARTQLRYWFTAYSNCHKAVKVDVDWNIALAVKNPLMLKSDAASHYLSLITQAH